AGAVGRTAPRRPRTRIRLRGIGFETDPAVHLPLGSAAGRTAAQQPVRVVLGRPARRPDHPRPSGPGRYRGLARRPLLPPPGRAHRKIHRPRLLRLNRPYRKDPPCPASPRPPAPPTTTKCAPPEPTPIPRNVGCTWNARTSCPNPTRGCTPATTSPCSPSPSANATAAKP